MLLGAGVALLLGAAAGALNGICVAFLRLQPIVTTYATSFLFSESLCSSCRAPAARCRAH